MKNTTRKRNTCATRADTGGTFNAAPNKLNRLSALVQGGGPAREYNTDAMVIMDKWLFGEQNVHLVLNYLGELRKRS